MHNSHRVVHCETPHSCQVSHCIPGLPYHYTEPNEPCYDLCPRECSECSERTWSKSYTPNRYHEIEYPQSPPMSHRMSIDQFQQQNYPQMTSMPSGMFPDMPSNMPPEMASNMPPDMSHMPPDMSHMPPDMSHMPPMMENMPNNICNMSCQSMQPRVAQYGCKPNVGISLNVINSPARFQPEAMCLPGQPICPLKYGGMPGMPVTPGVPGLASKVDSSQGMCRPRCMKYM